MRDLVDELLQAKVKARLFGGDHAPRLGRLVILERIGSGAMGTVFAAYDPRLDRKVAVKLVKSTGPEADRLVLQEARALGKLAHPNVVTIHDAGELDASIYIVMELAAGVSLRTWITGDRDWRDVVRVLREAAIGIAAAHRAGLVHRDIKPDNILVGEDRTRVVDFGLARELAIDDGSGAGTPNYMAPEVLADGPASPAADQFSFGVTLYEALYGVRPHDGRTRDELRATALVAAHARPVADFCSTPATGDTATLPRADREHAAVVDAIAATTRAPEPPHADDATVPSAALPVAPRRASSARPVRSRPPSWLHAIVVRALAAAPAERFASMDELAAALGRDRRRHRRLALAAVAALVGASIGVVAYRRGAATDPCAGGEARRAAVWSAAAAAQVRDGLGDAPWAGKVVDQLDAGARAWEGSYRRVCEASRVHGAQSDTLLDLRMRCLDRALDRFGALATALARPLEPAIRVEATSAVSELPRSAACETLRDAAELALPADPANRARARAAEQELDRAWVEYALGRYREARTVTTTLEPQTAGLDAPGLHAAVLLLAASIEARTGAPAAARARLDRALAAAAGARASELEADVWSRLLRHELFAGDPAHVIEWAPFAHAAAARAGRDGGELDGIIGEAHRAAGDLPAARTRLAAALASRDPLRPDQRALIEMNLGSLELAAGDLAAAETGFDRALGLAREALGDEHPTLALYLDKLAAVDRARGRIAAALARHDQSLANRRAAYGDVDRSVATSLLHRGRTRIEAGQLARASEDLEAARTIRVRLLGETHARLGEIDAALGDAAAAAGEHDRARARYDRAASLDGRLDLAARRAAIGSTPALAALPATIDPVSVDRIAALAVRATLLPADQRAALVTALLARWQSLGAAIDPALSLAVATAAIANADRAAAAAAITSAIDQLADEPSRIRLRAYRMLAEVTEGEARRRATARADGLAARLPELAER